MSKIDYLKMNTSATNLIQADSDYSKKAISDLNSSLEELESLSKNHDNFLLATTAHYDKVISTVKKNSESLLSVADSINFAIKAFSDAEKLMGKAFNIESYGLALIETFNFDRINSIINGNSQEEIVAGYDAAFYNSILSSLKKITTGTRNKTVVAANFLATTFPHLPYFWGGGHNELVVGVDPTWGTIKTVTSQGSDTTGTDRPYSLDCSGYVSWALKNGGYNIDEARNTNGLAEYGTSNQLVGMNTENIKPGDFAYMEGHIGMVLDTKGNEVTIAHCAGGGKGMDITIMDTTTGLITHDARDSNQEGKPYFDRIISVNYAD